VLLHDQLLQLPGVNGSDRLLLTRCQSRGKSGGLTDAADDRHHANGSLRLMIHGNTAARCKQIYGASRDQASVRNIVIFSVPKIMMTCAGALRIMDIDIVIAKRDRIGEPFSFRKIAAGQKIFALDHAALADSDLRRGHHQLTLAEALEIPF